MITKTQFEIAIILQKISYTGKVLRRVCAIEYKIRFPVFGQGLTIFLKGYNVKKENTLVALIIGIELDREGNLFASLIVVCPPAIGFPVPISFVFQAARNFHHNRCMNLPPQRNT